MTEQEYSKIFGEKLHKLRLEKNLRHTDLAEKLCVSRHAISRFEHGTQLPNIYQLCEISKILGVSTLYFIDGCELTPNGYQKEALRTEAGMKKDYPRIVNGLMGLNGEAGECIDILKKHLFHGHELDKEHLAKELGDVAWYLAVSAYAIGYDLESILRMNVEKLRNRYPDGFETEKSLHRAEGDV